MQVEDRDADIAVIGMSCRLPGARGPQEYWSNLCAGVESISRFSPEALLAAGVAPELVRDPAYVGAYGAIPDAYAFDAAFFGVNPSEARVMDPQQRVFLECAWSALEHAGYDPMGYPGAVGVYAGCGANAYLPRVVADGEAVRAVGESAVRFANRTDFLTTRVSYKLGLRGPSVAVQTACSTSLVAVHVACQSLLNRECELALAGGVTVFPDQDRGYLHQEGGIASPDGHCRAFDARAAGTVSSSGAGVVVLKRLADALRDGDTIHAVVRGSAINNDGAGKIGFTAPSVTGQAQAIAEALAVADVDPSTVHYVEAHGTGTALGDPIEIAALTEVFRAGTDRTGFCALGAAKTNIGHADSAAGVAGLIKAVLALAHRTLPPTLHFTAPNPETGLEGSPFYVNTELREWTRNGTPRRAGVSSFGMGGTNAHVVLEEAPERPAPAASSGPQLLVLSARTEDALERMRLELAGHLAAHPETPLADAAFTLREGRGAHPHRWAAVVRGAGEARAALEGSSACPAVQRRAAERPPPVAFLFPGQGTQYPGMARGLYASEPVFRQEIDRCAAVLAGLGMDLRAALFPPQGGEEAAAATLRQTACTQPALFAMEYATARLWMSWGVQPQAMLGHSIGEYVAACLAGVFSLDAALRLVEARGRLMQGVPEGAMLAVPLPEDEARALLPEGVSLAAVNGPASCVASGPARAIDLLEARLAEGGTAARRLHTSHAFHSAAMDPVLEAFAAEVRRARPAAPSIPFLSNVTGDWITAEQAGDPGYWVRHLRGTVRFGDGVGRLLEDPARVLLEVGPGETLGTFARRHPRGAGRVVVKSLPRADQAEAADVAVLQAAGALWTAGVEIDWPAVRRGESRRRVPLPTYPFERTVYRVAAPRAATAAPAPAASAAPAPTPEAPRPDEMPQTTATASAPAGPSRTAAAVTEIFARLLGRTADELHPDASFLEQGADSLLLMQASRTLETTFGVKVPFRKLLDGLATLAALSAHLEREAPLPEEPAPTPAPAAPLSLAPLPAAGTANAAPAGVQEIVAQQMAMLQTHAALMQAQLELLRGGAAAAPAVNGNANGGGNGNGKHAAVAASAAPAPARFAAAAAAEAQPASHGPHRPITATLGEGGGYTERQGAHFAELARRYTARTAGSRAYADENRDALADNRASLNFRMARKELLYPIVGERSQGSRLWDVDGNEYIDFTIGFGVHFFGHRPAFVVDAVEEQLRRGFHLGPQSDLAGPAARLFRELTGAERVTFCNTGSEAIMTAVRIARTVTGRDRIVMFDGSYHGCFDGILARSGGWQGGEPRSRPVAPGTTQGMIDDVVVLQYGTPQALEYIRAHGRDLAAVLVEPVQNRNPEFHPREFLHELRAITQEAGSVLVFDEMITGLRLQRHGAQGFYGVQADLATYGKVIGGGFPLGVVAGRAEMMDAIDGGTWRFGDDSYPAANQTFFAGTFCKHPVTMAAACAVLRHLRDRGDALYEELNGRTARLVAALREVIARERVPLRILNCASLFHFRAESKAPFVDLLFYHMLERGIYIWEGRACFLSTAHTDEDCDRLVRAFRESIHELRRGGFLPDDAPPAGGPSGPGGGATVALPADLKLFPPPAAPEAAAPPSFPLTPAQKQIWVHAQLGDDASRAYNEQITLVLREPLDEDALRAAVGDLMAHHEALRLVFDPSGETQRVMPSLPVPFRVSGSGPDGLAEAMSETVREVFDLAAGPLFRVHVHVRGPDHQVVQMIVHHLLADGFSGPLLKRDLAAAYRARRGGQAPQLPDAMQWSRYAALLAEHAREHARYEEEWLSRFRGASPLALPCDRPRPRFPTNRGGTERLRLGAELTASVRELGRRHGCTLFSTLLSGVLATLHRVTEQDDFVIGIPSACRPFPGSGTLVGDCADVLPIRSRAAGADDLLAFMKEVRGQVLDACEHEAFAYTRLQEKLGVARGPGDPPLMSLTFNLEPRAPEAESAPAAGAGGGAAAEVARFAKFDLVIDALELGDELELVCLYNRDLLDPATVGRLLRQMERVLEQLAARPDARLAELELMDPAERAVVLWKWNRTETDFPGADRCLHELFEAHALGAPDAPAAFFGDDTLTYGELDARANRLANHLRAHGVGPEVRVGICLERGPELLSAILGVLKAGGAYVPLDPAYPAERLAFMLASAGVSVLLTEESLRGALPPQAGVPIVSVDGARAAIAAESEAPPARGAAPGNLAYVIFTSGSTGIPKGIALAHRGVVNNLLDLNHGWGVGPADRVLLLSALSFDMSVYETLGILAAGGAVVIPRSAELRDPARWAALMRAHAVTVWNSAPALLGMLVDHVDAEPADAPPALRLAFLGGDWVPVPLPDRLRAHVPGMDVVVMGGATEASIHSIIFPVRETDPEWTSIPYGAPMANQRAYVLDPSLRPVPVGVPGELYLGGVGLARGYTGRPDLTAERFLPDAGGWQPGARMYRTGDAARWRPDGTLELIGRLDHQVKIRGFRIETGEIEALLRQHPAVERAVVGVRQDEGGDRRLAAWVVPDPETAPVLSRLLQLQAAPEGRDAAWSELPNRLPVAHLNANETEFTFREVWQERLYLRHGVTIADGDCVFDVGANIGLFSLLAGRSATGVRVFAFEPIPPVFDVLRLNARLHGLDVRLFNCGLSRRSGSATFTYYPHISLVSGQFADAGVESEVIRSFMETQGQAGGELLDELVAARLERREVTCPLRTVSEIIAEHGVECIDLLKVDVEKGEEEVLAGIRDEDWPRIRQLVVEVYDTEGRMERIRALLERHGFDVWVERDEVMEATAFSNLYARRPADAGRPASEVDEAADVDGVAEWTRAADLAESLHEHLRARLPEYMVPSAFVALHALPLSPNGKVDRKALPAPERAAGGDRYVAPRTPAEEVLAGIWVEVLGVERVGAEDDFFALGGHSLLATRVVSRARQAFGIELPVRALFENPTVAGLAGQVEALRRADAPLLPPVAPVERTGAPPLSFAQERLWFLDRLQPESGFYNIPVARRLRGALDRGALERALGEIVRRHEVLRTTFADRDGSPVQVVAPFEGFTLPVDDLSGLEGAEREAEVRRIAAAEGARPFDLQAGPVFRASLLRVADDNHVLLLAMHHVAGDGWSLGVLFRELSALYEAFRDERDSPLGEPPVQYADYAAWERAQLRGEVLDRQLAYWRERLAGAPALLELPTDRPRSPAQTHAGAHQAFELPAELLARLQALGRREGATLYMVLLGAFQLLLSRYGGGDDVVVGSPVAGRTRAEVEGLVGCFVNTLVLRTDLSADPSFREVLRRVRAAVLGAYEHQHVPFEKLVEELQPERSLSHSPLFQVMFTLNGAEGAWSGLPGLRVEAVGQESATAKFDLSLSMAAHAAGLRGVLGYRTGLFDRETVARMVEHLGRVLEQVSADADLRVSGVELLGEAERARVEAWSGSEAEYPAQGRVHERVEAQAARTPDAVAVVHQGATLTYAQLNGSANRLARALHDHGVRRGGFVPLLLERGPGVAVGMLAAMKAGAAFVPLDAGWPEARLRAALEPLDAAVVLADVATAALAGALGRPVLRVETDGEGAPDLGLRVDAEEPVYAIYTSGSTGIPKAAVVHHGGIDNRFHWMTERFGAASARCVLQTTRHVYDSAVWQLFWPLVHGGRTVAPRVDGEGDAAYVLELVQAQGVTMTDFVPSVFNALVPDLVADPAARGRLASLRMLVVGGEQITPETTHRLMQALPGVRVVNLYGSTECSIGSICHEVRAGEGGRIPIGRPIANTRALLLDRAGRRVPPGVPGEIHLGGSCVGLGYLKDPRRTAAAFVPDPYARHAGERLYRTGDLGRYRADGSIEYLGRLDEQVKVRGFRIEPGEVEAALRQAGARHCAVVVRDDVRGEKRLVAYVAGTAGVDGLRERLRRTLPDYMVPAAFVALDELPLTPGGKLDRRALPAPDLGEGEAGYLAPRTAEEEVLAEIWAEVLGTPRVSVDGDFFALGGHSLLAMRVVSRVRAVLGVEVPVRALFEAPTVAGLARRVDEVRNAGLPLPPPVLPVERTGPLPLSFAQERLWFLDRLQPETAFYNVPAGLRLRGALDPAALEGALGQVVRRHEALRTTFRDHDGVPGQVVAPFAGFALAVEDLSALEGEAREAEVRRRAAEHAARPFDLAAGPVFRAELLRLGAEEHVLLLCMHHIVSDGWSMGVLFRELSALYGAAVRGEAPVLPEPAVQYADYAAWQRDALRGEVLDRQLAWWTERLAGAPALLELPTDRPRPAVQSHRGAGEAAVFAPELRDALKALGRGEGATLYMVLLAAFQLLLSRYGGATDVVVGSPVAGRTRAEVEGLIGFFVNTLALRTDLSGEPTFRELLGRVRETTLGAYAHQDLPFERLVEEVNPGRSLNHTPLFQVMFALQNHGAARLALDAVAAELLGGGAGQTARFDLTLYMAEGETGLRAWLEYSTDLFEAKAVRRMLEQFGVLLEGIAADPGRRVGELPLLTEDERLRILAQGTDTATAYPREATVHGLFREQAERTPDAVAASFAGESLTYAELDARANRLANHLRALGVGPQARVGICLERGLQMLVAMLAALKAGGAYVPLDPSYPAERLAFMVRDAAVPVLLTEFRLEDALPAYDGRVVRLDADAARIAAESAGAPAERARAGGVCYVIYTSGSTGTPKGIAVPHRAVVRLVRDTDYVRLSPGDRVAQASNASFDAATFEVWGALLNGASLVGIARETMLAPAAFAEALRGEGVTTLFLTTALFNGTVREVPDAFRTLREVLFGGELVDPALVRRCLDAGGPRRLLHVYGPTEGTTFSSWHAVDAADPAGATVPIGRGIANTTLYVLDRAGRPAPAGVPGELYVGGDGLAHGYLGRPGMTAEAFVPHLFAAAPGERLYRTGDRVRWNGRGEIEFIGRVDEQVKIRGFRIEPGEVEAVLARHPAVRACSVVVREDVPGERRLVAYLAAEAGEVAAVRDALRARLPEHMLPAAFVALDRLPLTPNGKVDRRALPVPERGGGEEAYVAPRTPVEEALAGIWAEVLGVERVGLNDDFFVLGGHSLMIMRLAARVRAGFRVELPIRTVFVSSTLGAMADEIERSIYADILAMPETQAEQRLAELNPSIKG